MKNTQKMKLLSLERYNALVNASKTEENEKTAEEDIQEQSHNKEKERLPVDSIVFSMPKQYKSRAKGILNNILHSKILDWNENGELLYKNETVAHSHIADLIRDAIQEQRFTPLGSERFYQGLQQSNVPLALITNAKRRRQLQQRENTDTLSSLNKPNIKGSGMFFYPPGIPEKKHKKSTPFPAHLKKRKKFSSSWAKF